MVLLLFSCGSDNCRDVGAVIEEQITIKIERLENDLFASRDVGDVLRLLRSNPDVSKSFLHSDQYPSDSILASQIFELISDPFVDTLKNEALVAFEQNSEFQEDISGLFSILNQYYPQERFPVVKTIVSGLYSDLFISNELIVVGLDYFIGPNASYKPQDVPQYIQKRYTQRHLAPIIAKFIANSYSTTGTENTLLSEMIDFGKVNYLVSRLLPCKADSLIMGYSPFELDMAKKNREVIWANFIENELLYETSEFMKQKFLGERPNIHEISKNCPGRVGAWIGWEIVEAYMKEEDVSVQALLADTDHHKIFTKSKYKPIND